MSSSRTESTQTITQRKIIHIDMDAFYASVALREQPELHGLPVVVAHDSPRSVICAASYEARKFGLHSAMSIQTAKRICPQAIFVPPQFGLYRNLSQHIHDIFRRYTDKIEPLSLDEAYLDVTQNKMDMPFASVIAKQIRTDIVQETGLTASAGVASNKFLAKIASDWHKPNGQFVLPPEKVAHFLQTLPLGKIPGVGKRTLHKMNLLGWKTVGDVLPIQRAELVNLFSKWGHRLYDLARGEDNRPVENQRERVQISTEMTVAEDASWQQIISHIPDLSEDLWTQMQKEKVEGHTLVLKLKTDSFQIFTRSQTYSSVFPCSTALAHAAKLLAQKMPKEEHFRLIGLGISHLRPEGSQPSLWGDETFIL